LKTENQLSALQCQMIVRSHI